MIRRIRKSERKFFRFLIILALISWGIWITKGFLTAGHLGSITKSDKEITASVIFAPQPLKTGPISFSIYLAGIDHQPIRNAKISLSFRNQNDKETEIKRFKAEPAGGNSVFYNASDYAFTEGVWILDLKIERSIFGDAHMQFSVNIEKSKSD